jgi:ADP-ribose diphosphatase
VWGKNFSFNTLSRYSEKPEQGKMLLSLQGFDMLMRQKPLLLHSQIVASSRLFQIEEIQLRFANNQERTYERLKGRMVGAVMIAPLLDNDTILLVREYGVGIEDYFLSLPKGIIEPGENIFEAGNRELMEEIGYGAKHFTEIKSLASSPGYTKGTMPFLLAQDLYPEKRLGDEPEEIEVVPWKLSQLKELVARSDFTEARSIAGLYLIREMLYGK